MTVTRATTPGWRRVAVGVIAAALSVSAACGDVSRPTPGAMPGIDTSPPAGLLGGLEDVTITDQDESLVVEPVSGHDCGIQALDGLVLPGFTMNLAPGVPVADTIAPGASCSGAATLEPRWADAEMPLPLHVTVDTNGALDPLAWARMQRLATAGTGRWEFGADHDAVVEYGDTYIMVTRIVPAAAGDRAGARMISVTATSVSSLIDTAADVQTLRRYRDLVNDALQEIARTASIIGAAPRRTPSDSSGRPGG